MSSDEARHTRMCVRNPAGRPWRSRSNPISPPTTITSGRTPSEPVEIDRPQRVRAHALPRETPLLLGRARPAQAALAGGVDDAMPRELRTARQVAQRAPDEPRAPREPGFARDLSV